MPAFFSGNPLRKLYVTCIHLDSNVKIVIRAELRFVVGEVVVRWLDDYVILALMF